MSCKLIDEDRKHLEGRTLICSVSGGKDSAAMALWCIEQGLDTELVFADTDWESSKTYEYLGTLEKRLGKKIRRVGFPGGMDALIDWKGMFPSRTRRFCTQFLKTRPLSYFMEQHDPCVNGVGIRAEESPARAAMETWELKMTGHFSGIPVWRPLLRWTFEEVVAIHKRHGLQPNPLYLEGFDRVGCFPCIFESKRGIRMLAERYPERIDLLRRMEARMLKRATEKYGEDLDPSRVPTFFQRNSFRGNHPMGFELGLKEGGGMPIDAAVQWACSPRGQHPCQAELFALDERDEDVGCVRWGLCEHRSEGWPSKEEPQP